MKSPGTTYKDAGVDIAAAEESLESSRRVIQGTNTPGVLGGVGHFGALFEVPVQDYQTPVLVSSMDGVGTKLKVAIRADRYDSIGEDLVNHCVNDILTTGARPLYFLDYLSLGTVAPRLVQDLIGGMAKGCRQSGCALIGGETAEMPDIYSPGEFDMAGTMVGVVEKAKIIDGKKIGAGDVLIGLPSDGLHTNGYSLARKIFFGQLGWDIDRVIPELNSTLGDELLRVHKCYLAAVRPLLDTLPVHGMAHVTGGGIAGNLARILPAGLQAELTWSSWERPRLFRMIQSLGQVPEDDMRRTFNLGVGFIIVCPGDSADDVQARLAELDEVSYRIGQISLDGGMQPRGGS